jgi:hypothetical protein
VSSAVPLFISIRCPSCILYTIQLLVDYVKILGMIMNADILLDDEPKNIQQLPVNHANEAAPKAPAPVRVISDDRFGIISGIYDS